MEKCKNCTYVKNRNAETKKKMITRLSIIEGQIRGVKQMIEENRNCDDILMQVSAINSSLKSFGKYMLKSHLETCLTNDKGCIESMDDIADLFERIN